MSYSLKVTYINFLTFQVHYGLILNKNLIWLFLCASLNRVIDIGFSWFQQRIRINRAEKIAEICESAGETNRKALSKCCQKPNGSKDLLMCRTILLNTVNLVFNSSRIWPLLTSPAIADLCYFSTSLNPTKCRLLHLKSVSIIHGRKKPFSPSQTSILILFYSSSISFYALVIHVDWIFKCWKHLPPLSVFQIPTSHWVKHSFPPFFPHPLILYFLVKNGLLT